MSRQEAPSAKRSPFPHHPEEDEEYHESKLSVLSPLKTERTQFENSNYIVKPRLPSEFSDPEYNRSQLEQIIRVQSHLQQQPTFEKTQDGKINLLGGNFSGPLAHGTQSQGPGDKRSTSVNKRGSQGSTDNSKSRMSYLKLIQQHQQEQQHLLKQQQLQMNQSKLANSKEIIHQHQNRLSKQMQNPMKTYNPGDSPRLKEVENQLNLSKLRSSKRKQVAYKSPKMPNMAQQQQAAGGHQVFSSPPVASPIVALGGSAAGSSSNMHQSSLNPPMMATLPSESTGQQSNIIQLQQVPSYHQQQSSPALKTEEEGSIEQTVHHTQQQSEAQIPLWNPENHQSIGTMLQQPDSAAITSKGDFLSNPDLLALANSNQPSPGLNPNPKFKDQAIGDSTDMYQHTEGPSDPPVSQNPSARKLEALQLINHQQSSPSKNIQKTTAGKLENVEISKRVSNRLVQTANSVGEEGSGQRSPSQKEKSREAESIKRHHAGQMSTHTANNEGSVSIPMSPQQKTQKMKKKLDASFKNTQFSKESINQWGDSMSIKLKNSSKLMYQHRFNLVSYNRDRSGDNGNLPVSTEKNSDIAGILQDKYTPTSKLENKKSHSRFSMNESKRYQKNPKSKKDPMFNRMERLNGTEAKHKESEPLKTFEKSSPGGSLNFGPSSPEGIILQHFHNKNRRQQSINYQQHQKEALAALDELQQQSRAKNIKIHGQTIDANMPNSTVLSPLPGGSNSFIHPPSKNAPLGVVGVVTASHALPSSNLSPMHGGGSPTLMKPGVLNSLEGHGTTRDYTQGTPNLQIGNLTNQQIQRNIYDLKEFERHFLSTEDSFVPEDSIDSSATGERPLQIVGASLKQNLPMYPQGNPSAIKMAQTLKGVDPNKILLAKQTNLMLRYNQGMNLTRITEREPPNDAMMHTGFSNIPQQLTGTVSGAPNQTTSAGTTTHILKQPAATATAAVGTHGFDSQGLTATLPNGGTLNLTAGSQSNQPSQTRFSGPYGQDGPHMVEDSQSQSISGYPEGMGLEAPRMTIGPHGEPVFEQVAFPTNAVFLGDLYAMNQMDENQYLSLSSSPRLSALQNAQATAQYFKQKRQSNFYEQLQNYKQQQKMFGFAPDLSSTLIVQRKELGVKEKKNTGRLEQEGKSGSLEGSEFDEDETQERADQGSGSKMKIVDDSSKFSSSVQSTRVGRNQLNKQRTLNKQQQDEAFAKQIRQQLNLHFSGRTPVPVKNYAEGSQFTRIEDHFNASLRNSQNRTMDPGEGRKSPSSKLDAESMHDRILNPMMNHSTKSTMNQQQPKSGLPQLSQFSAVNTGALNTGVNSPVNVAPYSMISPLSPKFVNGLPKKESLAKKSRHSKFAIPSPPPNVASNEYPSSSTQELQTMSGNLPEVSGDSFYTSIEKKIIMEDPVQESQLSSFQMSTIQPAQSLSEARRLKPSASIIHGQTLKHVFVEKKRFGDIDNNTGVPGLNPPKLTEGKLEKALKLQKQVSIFGRKRALLKNYDNSINFATVIDASEQYRHRRRQCLYWQFDAEIARQKQISDLILEKKSGFQLLARPPIPDSSQEAKQKKDRKARSTLRNKDQSGSQRKFSSFYSPPPMHRGSNPQLNSTSISFLSNDPSGGIKVSGDNLPIHNELSTSIFNKTKRRKTMLNYTSHDHTLSSHADNYRNPSMENIWNRDISLVLNQPSPTNVYTTHHKKEGEKFAVVTNINTLKGFEDGSSQPAELSDLSRGLVGHQMQLKSPNSLLTTNTGLMEQQLILVGLGGMSSVESASDEPNNTGEGGEIQERTHDDHTEERTDESRVEDSKEKTIDSKEEVSSSSPKPMKSYIGSKLKNQNIEFSNLLPRQSPQQQSPQDSIQPLSMPQPGDPNVHIKTSSGDLKKMESGLRTGGAEGTSGSLNKRSKGPELIKPQIPSPVTTTKDGKRVDVATGIGATQLMSAQKKSQHDDSHETRGGEQSISTQQQPENFFSQQDQPFHHNSSRKLIKVNSDGEPLKFEDHGNPDSRTSKTKTDFPGSAYHNVNPNKKSVLRTFSQMKREAHSQSKDQLHSGKDIQKIETSPIVAGGQKQGYSNVTSLKDVKTIQEMIFTENTQSFEPPEDVLNNVHTVDSTHQKLSIPALNQVQEMKSSESLQRLVDIKEEMKSPNENIQKFISHVENLQNLNHKFPSNLFMGVASPSSRRSPITGLTSGALQSTSILPAAGLSSNPNFNRNSPGADRMSPQRNFSNLRSPQLNSPHHVSQGTFGRMKSLSPTLSSKQHPMLQVGGSSRGSGFLGVNDLKHKLVYNIESLKEVPDGASAVYIKDKKKMASRYELKEKELFKDMVQDLKKQVFAPSTDYRQGMDALQERLNFLNRFKSPRH